MLANICKGSLVDSGLYSKKDSTELSLLWPNASSTLWSWALLRALNIEVKDHFVYCVAGTLLSFQRLS